LVLKITDASLEGFSWLHLHHEEMIGVLLKLLLQGILVEEHVADLLNA